MFISVINVFDHLLLLPILVWDKMYDCFWYRITQVVLEKVVIIIIIVVNVSPSNFQLAKQPLLVEISFSVVSRFSM